MLFCKEFIVLGIGVRIWGIFFFIRNVNLLIFMNGWLGWVEIRELIKVFKEDFWGLFDWIYWCCIGDFRFVLLDMYKFFVFVYLYFGIYDVEWFFI